jgi:oligopeptide transport system ATP-binding protein
MYEPTSGEVYFDGQELSGLRGEALRLLRRRMQIIFQDPYASLDPRMTCGDIIGEPLRAHRVTRGRREYQELVAEALRMVELDPSMAQRYPHELSGGQRQRVGIARAIVLRPDFVVCDEPVSALDVSVQAQIMALLERLKEDMALTYFFISHDLAVVRSISDRVAVMYVGKIVEISESDELYDNPLHPYTRALLSAVPVPDPLIESQRKRTILTGDVASPIAPPSGCRFHPRCPEAENMCRQSEPELRQVNGAHWVACHHVVR